MKKTILCLGLLASSISHAATVQDELKAVSYPKTLACSAVIQMATDKDPHDMNELVTIIDYGNRFYIVRNPEVTDITILSPKLEYTEHYGPASGAGDKANILFIKGVGKTKGIYRMYFRDDKSTFTFLCP